MLHPFVPPPGKTEYKFGARILDIQSELLFIWFDLKLNKPTFVSLGHVRSAWSFCHRTGVPRQIPNIKSILSIDWVAKTRHVSYLLVLPFHRIESFESYKVLAYEVVLCDRPLVKSIGFDRR